VILALLCEWVARQQGRPAMPLAEYWAEDYYGVEFRWSYHPKTGRAYIELDVPTTVSIQWGES